MNLDKRYSLLEWSYTEDEALAPFISAFHHKIGEVGR